MRPAIKRAFELILKHPHKPGHGRKGLLAHPMSKVEFDAEGSCETGLSKPMHPPGGNRYKG